MARKRVTTTLTIDLIHDLTLSNINLIYKRVVNNIQIYLTNFFERFWRSKTVKFRSIENDRWNTVLEQIFSHRSNTNRGGMARKRVTNVDDPFNPRFNPFEYKFNIQTCIINNIQIYLTILLYKFLWEILEKQNGEASKHRERMIDQFTLQIFLRDSGKVEWWSFEVQREWSIEHESRENASNDDVDNHNEYVGRLTSQRAFPSCATPSFSPRRPFPIVYLRRKSCPALVNRPVTADKW